MADVFISYSREDYRKAHHIAMMLERQGWSVWWDDRIQAGEIWDEIIERQLSSSRCVIVLWSEASIQRPWVRAEAREGLHRKILVPVFLESVQPPLAFRLVQAVDLISWFSDRSHHGFDRLLAAIATVIGTSGSVEQDFCKKAKVNFDYRTHTTDASLARSLLREFLGNKVDSRNPHLRITVLAEGSGVEITETRMTGNGDAALFLDPGRYELKLESYVSGIRHNLSGHSSYSGSPFSIAGTNEGKLALDSGVAYFYVVETNFVDRGNENKNSRIDILLTLEKRTLFVPDDSDMKMFRRQNKRL